MWSKEVDLCINQSMFLVSTWLSTESPIVVKHCCATMSISIYWSLMQWYFGFSFSQIYRFRMHFVKYLRRQNYLRNVLGLFNLNIQLRSHCSNISTRYSCECHWNWCNEWKEKSKNEWTVRVWVKLRSV